MTPNLESLTEDEIVDMIESWYEINPVGGVLHIVTDDYNCDDSDLDYCEDICKNGDHWQFEEDRENEGTIRNEALDLIAALRPYSPEKREELIKRRKPWLYKNE